MRLYYADRDHYDEWTDAVSTGDFDDGFLPARLPGRRNHFFNQLPERRAIHATSPAPRRGVAGHQRPSREVTPPPPLGTGASSSTFDGVPWSRDAA